MSNDFHIRPATNEDVPAIKQIVFNVLKEYGLHPDEKGKDIDLEDIENNYIRPNGFFGVVIDVLTNSIVGTFGLYRIDDHTCELRKMYLIKQFRGKGIGQSMLETAIEIAKNKKYKRLILETIAPLKEAISLYKKFHFVEIPPVSINERVDAAYELRIE